MTACIVAASPHTSMSQYEAPQPDLTLYTRGNLAFSDAVSVIDFASISSLTLLLYDYLLTFSDEVELIWKKKFSAITVLFFVVRYFTIISKTIYLFWELSLVVDSSTSKVYSKNLRFERVEVANIVFGATAGVAVYTFHILRIYALWGKEWRVALLVAIVGYGIPANGLPLYSWSNEASIYWFLPSALAAEILIIILTIVKTLDARVSPPGIIVQQQLSQLLLRNGLVYFVILALTDALVLSSWSSFKPWAWNLWTFIYFTDTITAILVTRFILSLRSYNLPRSNVPGESADYTDQSAWSSPISSIDMIGNLGTPLDRDSRHEGDLDARDVTSENSDQVWDKTAEISESPRR